MLAFLASSHVHYGCHSHGHDWLSKLSLTVLQSDEYDQDQDHDR